MAKTLKQFLEAKYITTADYRISASGRKVHGRKKIADTKYNDEDGDGDIDKDDIKIAARRDVKEETIEEAVSVKKQDYSWGKMVTVHHGSDTSYPLHPEHQEAIKKLKDGEHTSFTDETNRKVTAHREGDSVHLSSKGTSKKTTIAHSHFNESVNKSDIPAYLRKKTGDQLTTKDLEKERTKNRSHPETLKKINGTEVKEETEQLSEVSGNMLKTKEDARLLQLARLGLLDKDSMALFRVSMQNLKADKQLSINQRELLLSVYTDLVNIVTGDDSVFQKVKIDVQRESVEDTHEIAINHADKPKNVDATKALLKQHNAVHSDTSDKSTYFKVHSSQVNSLKKHLKAQGLNVDHYVNGEYRG